MNTTPPLSFVWDATRSVMIPRRPNFADRVYVDWEEYRLGVIEERSINSHNHYFAALADAWSNLPDHELQRFPTVEHLRKYALIRSGFASEQQFVCTSKAEAARLAQWLKPIDDYSVIVPREATVMRYVAQSQSRKAMGNEEFQRSKTAVLDFVADLIGVTRKQLEQQNA